MKGGERGRTGEGQLGADTCAPAQPAAFARAPPVKSQTQSSLFFLVSYSRIHFFISNPIWEITPSPPSSVRPALSLCSFPLPP